MAIEAGAKAGIIIPDAVTKEYLKGRSLRESVFYTSDEGAQYEKVIVYDVSDIEPTVAFPHLPENTKPISQVGDIKIHHPVLANSRIS